MGKKRCRAKYVSKGQRRNVALKVPHTSVDRMFFKLDARRAGRKVSEVIRNPNTEETNRQFIRVLR